MAEKHKVAILIGVMIITGFLLYKTATHKPVLTPPNEQGSVECELREIREAFWGK